MKKLIDDYIKAINDTQKKGARIGEIICKAIEDIIPIQFTIGSADDGVDTICFWSNKRRVLSSYRLLIPFERVLEDVFPELLDYVDAPKGIYLTEDEAESIREKLEKLKE